MTSLVITLMGPDRPGLVSLVSDKVAEHGANWTDSVMANFAGQFAGIIQLEVPAVECAALTAGLRELESAELRINIATGPGAASTTALRRLKLNLVGHDRPGIIHTISSQLAQRGASIEKLQTRVTSAAWSGEQMFEMEAQFAVPLTLDAEELRTGLEGLANELMVDITFDSHVDDALQK